jgi:hypothetical protein
LLASQGRQLLRGKVGLVNLPALGQHGVIAVVFVVLFQIHQIHLHSPLRTEVYRSRPVITEGQPRRLQTQGEIQQRTHNVDYLLLHEETLGFYLFGDSLLQRKIVVGTIGVYLLVFDAKLFI